MGRVIERPGKAQGLLYIHCDAARQSTMVNTGMESVRESCQSAIRNASSPWESRETTNEVDTKRGKIRMQVSIYLDVVSHPLRVDDA